MISGLPPHYCPYRRIYRCHMATVDGGCDDKLLIRCPLHPEKDRLELLLTRLSKSND